MTSEQLKEGSGGRQLERVVDGGMNIFIIIVALYSIPNPGKTGESGPNASMLVSLGMEVIHEPHESQILNHILAPLKKGRWRRRWRNAKLAWLPPLDMFKT